MIVSHHRSFYVGLALLFVLSGCANIGPSSVESDRFDYSNAIAGSWQKMMLLNIIKLRYGDTPIFLEVGSIVNQYSLETEVNASAGFRSGGLTGDGVMLGTKGKYANRPTITYTPLTGKKFAKSLLAPIPPDALFSLVQSGWSADFILRICLSAINDLYNSSGHQRLSRKADEKFILLLDTLTSLQQSGGLGARLVEQGSGKAIVFFRRNLEPEMEKQIVLVLDLLDLDPDNSDFRLVYGSTAADNREIAMLTRSMLDITAELAQYVRVPEKHIRENRASAGNVSEATSVDDFRSRMLIESSTEKPDDAFLAIEYRNHWFYIEDTDYRSKRIFSFLLFLFTLAESGSQGISPVLTLPAG
jgi:hypothetical protein